MTPPYLFLSRKDIEEASKLIKSHFTRFGLTVHCGDRRNDGSSKTEAMFFPPPGKIATATDTADIQINEHEFFSYCDKFKYLGSIFTPSLKDDYDIQRQINQATGAFATMKRVLCNKEISKNITSLTIRCYSDQYSPMGMRELGVNKRTTKKIRSLPQQIPKENGRNHNL